MPFSHVVATELLQKFEAVAGRPDRADQIVEQPGQQQVDVTWRVVQGLPLLVGGAPGGNPARVVRIDPGGFLSRQARRVETGVRLRSSPTARERFAVEGVAPVEAWPRS